MARLIPCLGKEEISNALATIPETVEDHYKNALQNLIKTKGPVRAGRVLKMMQWIIAARRKLTVMELGDVLGAEAGEIIEMCPTSLIITLYEKVAIRGTIDRVQTVQLAHPSVRTYFMTRELPKMQTFDFTIKLDVAELEIGNVCMDRLHSLKQMESVEETLKEKPILAYVAEHWPSHVRIRDNPTKIRDEIFDCVLDFFDTKEYSQFCNWLRIYSPDGSRAQDPSCPAYYALLLEFPDIVVSMVRSGKLDLKCNIPEFGTMLQMASFLGQVSVAKFLLQEVNDNPNRHAGVFGSALEAAAARGHEDIVDFLLGAGAKANFIGGILGSPREAAQSGGYGKIVQRLLACHANKEPDVESMWRDVFQQVMNSYPYDKRLQFNLRLIGKFRFARLLQQEQLLLKGFIERSHPDCLLGWIDFLQPISKTEEWNTIKEQRLVHPSFTVPVPIRIRFPALEYSSAVDTSTIAGDLSSIRNALTFAVPGIQSVQIGRAIGNPVAILQGLLVRNFS
jgi:hypothetical protein